ncbi:MULTISPECIES: hypothetical protein [unclassified Nocardiopsis]|uniref:hypothetical protein n=1 Tax=Nocardiopsis TaxID=2013 RepID=UPI00387AC001
MDDIRCGKTIHEPMTTGCLLDPGHDGDHFAYGVEMTTPDPGTPWSHPVPSEPVATSKITFDETTVTFRPCSPKPVPTYRIASA